MRPAILMETWKAVLSICFNWLVFSQLVLPSLCFSVSCILLRLFHLDCCDGVSELLIHDQRTCSDDNLQLSLVMGLVLFFFCAAAG